jgi:hypothetical protein
MGQLCSGDKMHACASEKAFLAVFPMHRGEFLWHLQEIRGKLKLNRITVRIHPQVS